MVTSIEGGTLTGVETIVIDGGAGIDTLSVTGATLTPADITAVADADPTTAGSQAGWSVDTGTGSVLLNGVEEVTDGASNILLIGSGGFATIQAAIDAAGEGDTILIAAGTYSESVNVNKAGLTLVGVGAVVIDGTLSESNATYTTPTLAEWLKTTAGYTGGGIGIAVNADNVTIQNLTVTDALWGVELGANIDGTTLTDVAIESNVYGIYKQATSAVTNLTIEGGSISDGYIGITFDMAIGGGAVDGVTIDGTQFEHLLRKGIYVETLSNAHFTNITMDDVGQYGARPWNGTDGAGGNGININLKYGDYSNIEIDNFDFNNVGASDRDGVDANSHVNGGAIVVEARDDAPSYSGNPATLTNVTVHDGSLAGHMSTGIHVGEPGKANADPDVTVTNVTIGPDTEKSADHGDIANESTATLTITGTAAADSLIASGDSDGAFAIDGAGGADTIKGGSGDDLIKGGADADVIDGGAGSDTADYRDKTTVVEVELDGSTEVTVTVGGVGEDTISNIENIVGGSGNDILTGDGNDNIFSGEGGDDTITGGGGTDTTFYASTLELADLVASGGGWTVDDHLGSSDTLIGIKYVAHAGGRYLLIGNGGFATAEDAVAGATLPGDSIVFATAPVGPITINVTTPPGHDVEITIPYDVDTTITIAGNQNNSITTGAGNDTITTGSGNDVIETGAGDDYVDAGEGDDEIHGGDGAGNDVYDGGAGGNTVVYPSTSLGVYVELDALPRATQETLDGTTTIGALLVAALGDGHENDPVGYAEGEEIGTDVLIDVQNATGGAGNDTLIGDDGANVLDGGADNGSVPTDNADTLTGNGGADTLIGGTGADTVTGDGGDDTIVYVAGDGTDTSLDGGEDLEAPGDTLEITGTDGEDTIKIEIVAGTIVKLSSNADVLGGTNNVANIEVVTLDLGQGGDDTLDYSATGSGDDIAVNLTTGSATGFAPAATAGVAHLIGGAGDDALTGNDSANILTGNAGGDDIVGGGGGDTLTGGAGIDDISGGAGNDTINYTVGDGIDTTLNGGDDTDTLLVSGTAGDDTIDVVLTGSVITTIEGMAPTNIETFTLLALGGTGDTLSYAGTTSAVTANLATVSATGFSSINGVEHVTGGSGIDSLTGNGGANVLSGGGGNDTLRGAIGADTINGGDGDDTINYTIGDGADAVDGGMTGETLGDTLAVTGTAGDDTIDVVLTGATITSFEGGTVTGIESVTLAAIGHGAGGDALSYTGTASAVTVNLGTSSATGFTSITGIERVTGGTAGDTLTGDGNANTLTGGGGADSLDGGGGTDTAVYAALLSAGSFSFASAWQANGGADGIDGLTSIERVSHAGTGQFLLVGGGAFANRAAAEAVMGANDILVFASTPGAIADTDGAANSVAEQAANGAVVGIDANAATDGVGGAVTYSLLDNAGGRFAVNATTGVVTVANAALLDFDAAASHQIVVRATNNLGAFSDQAFTIAVTELPGEVIEGTDGKDELAGGVGDDTLSGDKGKDTLKGGDGDDTLIGGTGKDSIDGGAGTDTVSYAESTKGVRINLAKTIQKGGDAKGDKLSGIENVTGSDKNDTITGDDGPNLLDGAGGKDRLDGKGGIDTLIGGSGKDTFTFRKGYGTDTVADFETGDTIDIAMKGVKSFNALKDLMSETDGDVVIAFDGSDTLTLVDTTISALDKGDFHL